MREMLDGGPLDYLTGDYLAELTMLILGRDRQKNPELGYAKTFLRQLADCLTLIRSASVKIVSNAGGLNPAGLAQAIRALDPDLRVAYVEGDQLTWPKAITANAYLGAFGIAEALTAGADIVVTGRVTDASLTLGPAIAEFGWTRDDLDKLAAGIVAGHVLECGTQATGGNFSGFTRLDLSRPLGFPIAEISADGTVLITKHPAHGGAVTVDTVTAQLVYEIDSPRYLNPDVTTHLDTVQLVQEAKDQVKVFGVRGGAPPGTTKVGINRLGGHRNAVSFVLTGLDIEQKAAWTRRQLEAALTTRPAEIIWELTRTDRPDPATQAEASAILRCHVKDPDPDVVGRDFSGAAVELALASYPGFHVTAPPAAATPFGVFEAAYLPQSEVPHTAVLPDGTRSRIAPPEVSTPAGSRGPIADPDRAVESSREWVAGARAGSGGPIADPDRAVESSREWAAGSGGPIGEPDRAVESSREWVAGARAGSGGPIAHPDRAVETSREWVAGSGGPVGEPDRAVEASRESRAVGQLDGATRPSRDGAGRTTTAPLGRLVHARSGDKGGTANVGVWVPAEHPRRRDAYEWLAGWLDADRVRVLLPEAAELDVTVYRLPHLAALNIVIERLLGDGVAASTRSDPQAKAVGEWLRARNAEIPTELL
ncbi:acyclic terpene utilization AtuA family protein [Actinoplanes ianthinogenes]